MTVKIRTDALERKYEVLVNQRKVYEFQSASELHEFALQAMSTLRWSIRNDFGKLDELSGK
jgi:hypothetical protein